MVTQMCPISLVLSDRGANPYGVVTEFVILDCIQGLILHYQLHILYP